MDAPRPDEAATAAGTSVGVSAVAHAATDRIVERLLATEPRAGRTRVLAVDGHSGSGKTTLAGLLADRLAGAVTDLEVVHLDELYPGWDGLARTPALLVQGVLEPLAGNRTAGFARWDWAADQPGAWRPVPATELLIIEGAGSGSAVCRPYLSLLVWLDAPEPTRRTRALARDGERYAPHWDRWAAQEHHWFAEQRTRAHADLVLETDLILETDLDLDI